MASSLSTNISLPFEWTPRKYQIPFLSDMHGGLKRAMLVWCRRSGKDSTCLNYMATEAMQRVGTYYYMLPTQRQGRKVVWMGIGEDGRRIIDQAFPAVLRKRCLEDEMLIELVNGSIIQIVGSDSYDSIVGTNPVGIVFSEWALSDPRAYDFVRPILAENGGWAVFNTTPRGKNHAYDLRVMAAKNPLWHFSLMTADDTGHISKEDIDAERLSGMAEDRIQQEFYCSFDALSMGLIYDTYVNAMEAQTRIGAHNYDPRYPVTTSWDLGHRDATAILFWQRIGRSVYLIDYIEERGKDFPHFVKLVREKPYAYNVHILPHDGNRFEFGTGLTCQEVARQHGFPVTIAPKLSIEEGIQNVRALLPRVSVDMHNCARVIQAMRHYRYEEDEANKSVKSKPRHDWASHVMDALRYFAVTPETQGVVAQWAAEIVADAGNWVPPATMMGHNGGPPMDDYDPLHAYGTRQ